MNRQLQPIYHNNYKALTFISFFNCVRAGWKTGGPLWGISRRSSIQRLPDICTFKSRPRNHRQLTPWFFGTGVSLFWVAGIAECKNGSEVAVELGVEIASVQSWGQNNLVDQPSNDFSGLSLDGIVVEDIDEIADLLFVDSMDVRMNT